jgi:glycosyltransferase involved in cell wall biosynthesis
VDDGSTDASTQIALGYAARYPEKVCYLEHSDHRNQGMSASRNIGIQQARGRFIAFLDADDIWLPEKLKHQVRLLEAHPDAAMVYGNTLYWFSWSGNPPGDRRDYSPDLGVQPDSVYEPPKLLPLFLRGLAAVPCICSLLIHKQAVERVIGFEDSFHGMYEDQAFYAKVFLQEKVYVSGECFEWYRQHPNASTAIAREAGQEPLARGLFLSWLRKYLEQIGVKDPEVWQALRREEWRLQYPGWLPASRKTLRVVRWVKKWLLRLDERFVLH